MPIITIFEILFFFLSFFSLISIFEIFGFFNIVLLRERRNPTIVSEIYDYYNFSNLKDGSI